MAELELTTTVEPEQVVNIDGEPYPLRTRFSTTDTLRMRDLGEEVKELMELRGDARTAEHDSRIIEIQRTLTNAYIDAPRDLVEKLPSEQAEKLLLYVTAEVKKRRDPTGSIGDSPPDSQDSTESATG